METIAFVFPEYQPKVGGFGTWVSWRFYLHLPYSAAAPHIPKKTTQVLALPILFPRNLIRTCVSQRQHAWTQVPTALSALTVGAAWARRSKIRSLTGMQKALMHRGLAHDEINHRNRSNCDRDKQTKGEKRTCCQETGTEGHSSGRCSTGRTQLLSFGFVT